MAMSPATLITITITIAPFYTRRFASQAPDRLGRDFS
jgi:hypothetical protein